jgi:hypothetical protein
MELTARAIAFLTIALPAVAAATGGVMPIAQQNALVHKYCAVCHTDAARNGGLSLQHYDATQAVPSLNAMLLSKLTGGVLLEKVNAAPSDPNAAALVAKNMQHGAMGAAGLPIPDKPTIGAFINALASESTGASEWNVQRVPDPATSAIVLAASILRELPSPNAAGEAAAYRLVIECNTATHESQMQLAWAPVPRSGTLHVSVDGITSRTYRVEGTETMGNGSQVKAGPAAINLIESKGDMPLPAHSLTFGSLFPDQTVAFSFDSLPPSARESLAACFSANGQRLSLNAGSDARP